MNSWDLCQLVARVYDINAMVQMFSCYIYADHGVTAIFFKDFRFDCGMTEVSWFLALAMVCLSTVDF